MGVRDMAKTVLVPIFDKVVYASNAYVQWKTFQNNAASTLIDFQKDPSGPSDVRLLEFIKLLQPVSAENLELVRVGGAEDGGYAMHSDFGADQALSLGVGPDVSWDADIASRGVRVTMFDPTVKGLPESVNGGHFIRIGVSADGKESAKFKSLRHLLDLASISSDEDFVFKMDVEGAEWGALLHDDNSIARATQIVMELHSIERLRDSQTGSMYIEVLKKLHVNHVPVHIHANNISEIVRFDTYWFPNAIEVTFVRKDLLRNPVKAEQLQNEIDAPCDPRYPEVSLQSILDL